MGVSITKTITSNLSHIKNNHHSPSNNAQCLVEMNPNKQPRNYQDVSNQLQLSMEHELKVKVNKLEDAESPRSRSATVDTPNNKGIVIGAKYGINDHDQVPFNPTKLKFNRLKNKFGNKMKEQINKIQQNMVKVEIQKHKSPESPKLNELNARNVIKETEKVLIMKTKQQLNTQCAELQGLANELSSTIEQKEVVLESLRFTNTYLGLRVIALEKLMKMQPGKAIKNQEELIRDALDISPEQNKNEMEITEEKKENVQEKNENDQSVEQQEEQNNDDIEHEQND